MGSNGRQLAAWIGIRPGAARRTQQSITIHAMPRLMIAMLCLLFMLSTGAASRNYGQTTTRPAPTAARDPALVGKIDDYIQAQVRASGFSGTILLARAGAPLVAKGYGFANAEWQIPNARARQRSTS
jgi:CubicO group peptidase (beta-lactamase class C family)